MQTLLQISSELPHSGGLQVQDHSEIRNFQIFSNKDSFVTNMSFSPDGKHIAFGDGSSHLEWAVFTVEGNEVYKGRIEAGWLFGTVDGWNPANHPGWCWNPVNNGINYLSAGAGFQPSTVRTHFFFSTTGRFLQTIDFTCRLILNGAWPRFRVQEGFAKSKTGLYWMQHDQLLVLTPNQGHLLDFWRVNSWRWGRTFLRNKQVWYVQGSLTYIFGRDETMQI